MILILEIRYQIVNNGFYQLKPVLLSLKSDSLKLKHCYQLLPNYIIIVTNPIPPVSSCFHMLPPRYHLRLKQTDKTDTGRGVLWFCQKYTYMTIFLSLLFRKKIDLVYYNFLRNIRKYLFIVVVSKSIFLLLVLLLYYYH